ncbi:hypothetical protein SARC_01927 [Sphaeroforma arctica JP610]|uniref:Uncharacterized protein n=1 Tax=Sphaeroforma arctica JP610 TaxID=667725 RepID=A0A0L0GAF6_9EUKA|nr:hypothetical protein SARC_01927 [Sphaeroforma arctica JP610]KNC85889.1 hypothetical protein SARC_01927 [Sphaeroforma arctica JP610]|eukprot:XP_014159791.1 hypothetical protein SARC_01927 [Sphaeroforma arctica JP610]
MQTNRTHTTDTKGATNAHIYHSGTSNSTDNDLGAGDSGKAEVMLECAQSMDTISEEVESSATDMTYTGDTLRDMNLASEAETLPKTGRENGLKLVNSSWETVRDMDTTGDRINTTATTAHAKLVKTASVGNKEESVGAAKVELALLYTNRGLCHSKLDAYNRAHKDWYRAIEINVSDLKPLVSLTKLQMRLGELRIAKILCTDGLALCEKYPTERNQSFLKDLASCHILLARLQQAHKAVSSWCAETFEINLTGNDGDGDSAQALNTVESDIVLLKQHCPESVLYKLFHVRCLGHGMVKYDEAVELVEELVMRCVSMVWG